MTQPEASKPESAAVEISPCPFCGSEKVLAGQTIDQAAPNWYVTCHRADCAFTGYSATRAEAIAAWNRRVPAAPATAVEPIGEPCRLDACPAGLFLHHGSLGFRSEYWTSGKPDAYVVESGEYYWGGTSNANDRSALIVQPLISAPGYAKPCKNCGFMPDSTD